MTDKRGTYNADGGGITPAALLPYTDDRYQAPTPADVRALKSLSGLTGRELCLLAGVEDPRTWRRWSQESSEAGARQIPYSAWRLLLLEMNLVQRVETDIHRRVADNG
jgi:hypothetical protein